MRIGERNMVVKTVPERCDVTGSEVGGSRRDFRNVGCPQSARRYMIGFSSKNPRKEQSPTDVLILAQ
jgi:hypothetical protein